MQKYKEFTATTLLTCQISFLKCTSVDFFELKRSKTKESVNTHHNVILCHEEVYFTLFYYCPFAAVLCVEIST